MNDELVQLVEQVKPVSEAFRWGTEFEIITTMMFLYFGEINPVDFV